MTEFFIDATDRVVLMALALDADLSDGALIHAGSALWNDWRNHVVLGVRECWPSLSRESRAVARGCLKQALVLALELVCPGKELA